MEPKPNQKKNRKPKEKTKPFSDHNQTKIIHTRRPWAPPTP